MTKENTDDDDDVLLYQHKEIEHSKKRLMRGCTESTHSSSTPPSNAPSWAICVPSLRDGSLITPSRDFGFTASSSVTPTQDMNASTGMTNETATDNSTSMLDTITEPVTEETSGVHRTPHAPMRPGCPQNSIFHTCQSSTHETNGTRGVHATQPVTGETNGTRDMNRTPPTPHESNRTREVHRTRSSAYESNGSRGVHGTPPIIRESNGNRGVNATPPATTESDENGNRGVHATPLVTRMVNRHEISRSSGDAATILTPARHYDKVTPMRRMLDCLVSDDDNSSSDEVWDLDS